MRDSNSLFNRHKVMYYPYTNPTPLDVSPPESLKTSTKIVEMERGAITLKQDDFVKESKEVNLWQKQNKEKQL